MKKLFSVLSITFLVCWLFTGCGTTTQQVSYATTDALGSAVDKAMQLFSDYEVGRAKAALPAGATVDQQRAWILTDATWKQVSDSHARYLLAYNAWCSANAAAVGGTADPSFRVNAITAAGQLTTLIAQFVPSVKPITQ